MILQSMQERLTADRLKLLSPQLRKAARFVVEHPGEVAMRSQRQVARTAKLPPPTFTRLAHAIGYDSYDDLRDQCRAEVLQNRTVLAERAEALVTHPTDLPGRTGFFNDHALSAVQNLNRLMQQIDHIALNTATRQLAQARRVVLVGVMSARPILEYTAYIANLSLGDWSLLGRDGDGAASQLASLGSEDMAIALSTAPYAAATVTLTERLAECDVPILAVTDNHLSPLADKAAHRFFLDTTSPQFFPSHVAAMALLEALIGMVVREKGAAAQQYIAAVERQKHVLEEYWQD